MTRCLILLELFLIVDHLFQVHFNPVPSNAEIRGKVPEGRAAIQSKAYEPPMPCFGPTSEEGLRLQAEAVSLEETTGQDPDASEHRGAD